MLAGVAEHGAPHQLHLSLFSPHEIRAYEQEERHKALRKEQRQPKPPRRFWLRSDSATRGLFDALDPAVLDHPLGGPEAGNDLNCDVDPLREEEADTDANHSAEEATVEWSDAAIDQLHEAKLHYSLRALQARGNGAEKREILEWIFAPQAMVVVVTDDEDGRQHEVLLPQPLTPFSFERCCRTCGLSPERLMDGLMPILREVGLGNVFNEIANGRNNQNADDA